MNRPARTTAEKMIKVDHAGENGAVNIYRAQVLVSRLRAKDLVPVLTQNQQHEEKHREIFRNYLAENHIRRCVSYHACGLGGFTLGFVTGIIGPKAVAATTYAVEHVVLEHLEHQQQHLIDTNPQAHECVCAILEDEKAHHDHAEAQLQHSNWMTTCLISIVKWCARAVIRFGMR